MDTRIIPAVLASFLAVSPVLGAEAGKPKGAPGSNVEMPPIIAPVMDAGGKLSGYAYVSTTIRASSPDTAMLVRGKTPFIQDAFVRDVNARNIAIPGDPPVVDKPALAARFLETARAVAGEKRVVGLEITQIQMSPLRHVPAGKGKGS